MLQDNLKKETIRLKFMAEQGIYIETCPLHSSQRLVSKTDEYMIFELNLKPTFDFFRCYYLTVLMWKLFLHNHCVSK